MSDEIIIAKPYAANEWARLLIRDVDYRIELYWCATLEHTRRLDSRREAIQVAQRWLNRREVDRPA